MPKPVPVPTQAFGNMAVNPKSGGHKSGIQSKAVKRKRGDDTPTVAKLHTKKAKSDVQQVSGGAGRS